MKLYNIYPNTDYGDAVLDQLPRTLRDRMTVTVSADPYNLVLKMRLWDKQDAARSWECSLVKHEGPPVSYTVPSEFLARLCVEVV